MGMDLKFLIAAKDEATGVVNKVGSSFQKLGTEATAAYGKLQSGIGMVTGAIGVLSTLAAGAAFGKMVQDTVNWNLEIGRLAQTMGSTAEQASIFRVAMSTLGVDQDVAEKGALRLAKTLTTNEDAFKRLGVATRDSSGHLRSTTELMPEVNQKLSEMAAGTDRNVAAQEIYGKSWGEIRSLLKVNKDAMEEARETAQRLHLIVGEEGVAQAKQYQKGLNELKLVSKSLEIQVGNALLPSLLKLGEWFGKAGPQLSTGLGYALKGIVKAFETAGSTIGFFVAEAVTGFEAINRAAHLDFKGAWGQVKAMKDIQTQYWSDLKKTWTDWSDPKQTQKKASGDRLDLDDDAAEKAKKEEEKKLKELQASYKEHAQKILETEKDRWQKLAEGEKKYASLVKSALETKIKEIDELKKRLADITNTLDEIDKKRTDKLTPGIDPNLDAFDKYNAQISLLRKQEEAASNITDTDKRTKALTQIYDAWSQITDEVKVGNDLIITQQDVLERAQTEMERLRGKITKPYEEQKTAAEAAKDVLSKMYDSAILKADEYKQHIEQLSIMMNNLKDKDVTINFKATGIDQLQRVAALTSGTSSVSSGNYSSLGEWWDSIHTGGGWQTVTEVPSIKTEAFGGPVEPFDTLLVGDRGPELLKLGPQGGTIIPNNKLGGNSISIEGIQITVQSAGADYDADNLARKLVPALRKQLGRIGK